MAPRANPHTERWIGMLIASESQLRNVLREYVEHCNDERHIEAGSSVRRHPLAIQ
jgi:hypothetical protein